MPTHTDQPTYAYMHVLGVLALTYTAHSATQHVVAHATHVEGRMHLILGQESIYDTYTHITC